MQGCSDIVQVEFDGSAATEMSTVRLDAGDAAPNKLVLFS
jgi:hypothetical protein